jgi:membrane protein DedA with SNARE-associated domain
MRSWILPSIFGVSWIEWLGLPVPGEAALVSAGVVEGQHLERVLLVILTAALAAASAGMVSYWIGARFGRSLATRPGRLYAWRLRQLGRGERFYARYGRLAVFVTPGWLSGMSAMRRPTFIAWNALAAAVWAASYAGLAALLGPAVEESAGDWSLAALLVVATIVFVLTLRRRRTMSRGSRMLPEAGPERPRATS